MFKRIAAVVLLVLLALLVLPMVNPTGNTALAWNCSQYNFSVTREGAVSVYNGSNSNEPSQTAKVYINNTLITTLNVPALAKNTGAGIGNVATPGNDGFTWKVKGSKDCEDSGSYPKVTPPPTPKPDPIKVTLCHATESEVHPYSKITVNVNSIGDATGLNGHGIHMDDIIPPFSYGAYSFPGRGDQSILANDCKKPQPPATEPPTPPATEPPTGTPPATPPSTPPATPPAEEDKIKVCRQGVVLEILESELLDGDLYPVPEEGCTPPRIPPTATKPPKWEPETPVCEYNKLDRYDGQVWKAWHNEGWEYAGEITKVVKNGKLSFIFEPLSAIPGTYSVFVNGEFVFKAIITVEDNGRAVCGWSAPDPGRAVPATGGQPPSWKNDYSGLILAGVASILAFLVVVGFAHVRRSQA